LAEWLVHGVEILFHLGMDLDGSALRVVCGGVDGNLGWWQLEDQPTTTGVDPGKSKHVTNEDPVGLCVGAVENDMCSVDHLAIPLMFIDNCF
jgi:hypothetical protein